MVLYLGELKATLIQGKQMRQLGVNEMMLL
jgi:hypothetical protein